MWRGLWSLPSRIGGKAGIEEKNGPPLRRPDGYVNCFGNGGLLVSFQKLINANIADWNGRDCLAAQSRSSNH